MRVLVISAAFPPMRAGEADHTLHLCQRLAESGFDIELLTSSGCVVTSKLSFKVHRRMRNWTWSELPKLISFIKRFKPDGILLYYSGWLYGDHPMITFAPTIAKTIAPHAAFVTQFGIPEGSAPEETSLVARAIRKGIRLWAGSQDVNYGFGTLLRDSDRVVVLSEHHKDELVNRFPAVSNRILLLPPPPIMVLTKEDGGATRLRGRDLLGLKPNEFVLLYFGYFYPGKGIETLLKAFQLVSQGSDLKLVMVGDDPDNSNGASYRDKMNQLGRELGVHERIIWAPSYSSDSDEASVFLRAADACVLPFDHGVTLNRSSVAAAAAHGLPIVTTKWEFLESPFIQNAPVLLCTPKSPESLAEAIHCLIRKPALQQRLHLGSLELARQWFSWENTVIRISDALTTGPSPR